MVTWIWPECPVCGLHGLHPSSHSHLCHSQTAGTKNHHCWQDGEKHYLMTTLKCNLRECWDYNDKKTTIFSCSDEGCLLLPLLSGGVAHGIRSSQSGFALLLRPSPRSHLSPGVLQAILAHLWTDPCGRDGWYKCLSVHHAY